MLKKGKRKSFNIQFPIFAIIIILICWQLNLYPFASNFYIKNETSELTGQNFWSWEEYEYEEIGVRGEGYSLFIYRFDDEMQKYFQNPNEEFFTNFPSKEKADINWTKTPVKESDQETLKFVTPTYGGWDDEIINKQDFIRELANQKGAYYSYQKKGTNFYLIVPEKRLVILINHNM